MASDDPCGLIALNDGDHYSSLQLTFDLLANVSKIVKLSDILEITDICQYVIWQVYRESDGENMTDIEAEVFQFSTLAELIISNNSIDIR